MGTSCDRSAGRRILNGTHLHRAGSQGSGSKAVTHRNSGNVNRAPEWGLAGVIITGGAGFIGSALARSIAGRGARVLVLDDLSTGSAAGLDGVEGVTMVQTDVRDAPTLAALFEQARPSIVYHLAALHYIPDCNRRPLDTVSINVNGTHNVLEASARTRVRRFIFASSAAVYAPTDERISEDHP